jgi:hypothetical protein
MLLEPVWSYTVTVSILVNVGKLKLAPAE